jgi:hypothetical protein
MAKAAIGTAKPNCGYSLTKKLFGQFAPGKGEERETER